MALPANIRVNMSVPFPAMVTGSGPITIGKANGVWQVGFSIATLGSIVPPAGNYATDFLIGFDSIAGTFFKVALSNLTPGARPQRSVTATPIVIAGSDQILNCNINVAAACALPAAATRNGVPLTFADVGAQAGAHNITLTANAGAGDTINGAATFVINTNRGNATLVPFNDGVNTGWWT
jgi:hypothetical protein